MSNKRVAILFSSVASALLLSSCSGGFQGSALATKASSASSSISNIAHGAAPANQTQAQVAGPGEYDVIVIAGQSNAVGFGCGPATDESTDNDSRIFQVTPTNQIIPAKDPLFHTDGNGNAVGFGMTFARLYAKTVPGRKILIVPTAKGSSSIIQWNDVEEGIQFTPGTNRAPADTTEFWDAMLSRTRYAMDYGGQNNLVAFLWQQGETDYTYMVTSNLAHAYMASPDDYGARLSKLISDVRVKLPRASQVPFIIGEVPRFWSTLGYNDNGVLAGLNATIASVAKNYSHTFVASSNGLVSSATVGCNTDTAHISAESQVQFGRRLFTGFASVTATALPPMNRMGFAYIADSVPVSCDDLNPDAIKSLSKETILWLASLQSTGLTLHETYVAARQAGYSGELGHGAHLAWLSQDPSRQTNFNSVLQSFIDYPMLPQYASIRDHHLSMRAQGYQGIFQCGGGNCWASGGCDELGVGAKTRR